MMRRNNLRQVGCRYLIQQLWGMKGRKNPIMNIVSPENDKGRGRNFSRLTLAQSVASSLNNDTNSNHEQTKKGTSFFRKLLMVGGVFGGLLTLGYYYAKVTEKVTAENFNDKSFTCVHRDGKTKKEILSTFRHHFQMSMPPIAVSSNMCIVDLGKSELMVYNPVELTDIVKNELGRLGKVKLIILPNAEHLKYAGQYFKYYILENKDGKMEKPFFYCPYSNKDEVINNLFSKLSVEYPTLKKEDITKNIYTLPSDNNTTPREWPREWQLQFDLQVVTGLKLNEVLMCHKPTKTLIACDTVMDFREPITTKVDKPNHTPILVHYSRMLGIDGLGPVIPPSFRFLITDKDQTIKEFTKIFTWNWEHIVMAHGNNMITQNPEQARKLKVDYSESLSNNLKL